MFGRSRDHGQELSERERRIVLLQQTTYLERTTCACRYSFLMQISQIQLCNCFTTHVLHQKSHVLHKHLSCITSLHMYYITSHVLHDFASEYMIMTKPM